MFANRNYSELPSDIPSTVDSFNCSRNKLTNLIGAPEIIIRSFFCIENKLTSLIGISKIIGNHLFIGKNSFLDDVSNVWNSEIKNSIFFDLTPNMTILPLVKFKIITDNFILKEILEKNKGSLKQNVIDLQFDLIENGFENNAKWKP